MKKAIILSLFCFAMSLYLQAQVQTKIFLLRHADRTVGDDLSPLGIT